jgi:hypothetical protein
MATRTMRKKSQRDSAGKKTRRLSGAVRKVKKSQRDSAGKKTRRLSGAVRKVRRVGIKRDQAEVRREAGDLLDEF